MPAAAATQIDEASLQLCGVIPNLLILEYQWGEADWRSDLVVPSESVVDGCLRVPETPGLGVRLNEALLG